MILLDLLVLAAVAGGSWWLTGIDKTAGGESKCHHYLTRALRCVAVVLLVAIFLRTLLQGDLSMGDIPILIILPVGIALILRSSLSELAAHGFLGLVDPALHDHREIDPNLARRHLDAIARLIRQGRQEEAIRLCQELKLSGEVDLGTLDSTLAYLGVPPDRLPARPLAEAARLRTQGDFVGAERLLQTLLLENPANDAAAILIMRLYAEDFKEPSRAQAVLHALEQQPNVPASYLEFARRSIEEWSRPPAATQPMEASPESLSVDELLARRSLGLAVERLQAQIIAQPDDFELRLKLAEVHAVHCKNLSQAEKLIGQLERSSHFSAEQMACARSKLAAWRFQG